MIKNLITNTADIQFTHALLQEICKNTRSLLQTNTKNALSLLQV